MRAPLSIIIPTLNAQGDLPKTLASLMEGLEAGLVRELVVSDGGSDDCTRQIAEEVGAIWVAGSPSRGGQLRRGVEAAEGAWLLLLHADTQLSPDWSDVVRDAIAARHSGYFRLEFRTPRLAGRWVARWANLRSRALGLPYGDQGLLVSASLLQEKGGVPDIPLMEDVALARKLRGRLVPLSATAHTSFERYERDGVLRRGGRNLSLLVRYLLGADPSHLAARYRR